MSKKEKIIASVISAFVLLTTAHSTLAAEAPREKCFGIVKAGMNDCATAKAACAGSATKDKQGDSFLLLPKGICAKIVGGSLKAKP